MRTVGSQAAHVTANGTTVLVNADQYGWLHRVTVGRKGSGGTVTLQGAGGGDVHAVIDVTEPGTYEFDLDCRLAGLEAVAASFAGSPDVTIIYEG